MGDKMNNFVKLQFNGCLKVKFYDQADRSLVQELSLSNFDDVVTFIKPSIGEKVKIIKDVQTYKGEDLEEKLTKENSDEASKVGFFSKIKHSITESVKVYNSVKKFLIIYKVVDVEYNLTYKYYEIYLEKITEISLEENKESK